MNKISMLRAIINDGWTIANRQNITSKIGQKNFIEISKLAQNANLEPATRSYNVFSTFLELLGLPEIKSRLLEMGRIAKLSAMNKGTIYKRIKTTSGKIEKKPLEVEIRQRVGTGETSIYEFWDKDYCVGEVNILNMFFNKKGIKRPLGLFCEDFPQYGIEGDRVIIKMLQNFDRNNYGGIGKLADKVAVQHCLLHGIEPNIISSASYSSHMAHYLRGKRFISFDGVDYNKYFENLAKKHKEGEKIDTSKIGSLLMYMPRKIIESIKLELKERPILQFLS